MGKREIDVDSLQARYSALLAERNALVADRDRLQKLYDKLTFEHELLQRQVIGPKAERVHNAEAQLSLLSLIVLEALGRLKAGDESGATDAERALADARALLASANDDAEEKTKPKNKAPHGRRKVELEDLLVRRVVLEPPERTAAGGELLERVGEEITELIDRVPGSLIRLQVVRPKYTMPDPPPSESNSSSEGSPTESTTPLGAPLGPAPLPQKGRDVIVIAPMPERAIPRCMVEPGVLAHVLVSKFADHIPLHRQEVIFKRDGLRLARSTLGDWVQASTNLLAHVVDAMWDDAKTNAPYWLTDATGVLVLAKDVCKRAHFYVVVVPRRHVLYRFTWKNDGDTVAAILNGFKGLAHADASSVYHELYLRDGDIVEVGCWAHARRKFFDALSRDRERALVGIGFISHLYDAHRATVDSTGVADTERRALLARPILAKLLAWIDQELSLVEEGSPIHQAIGYVDRQREPLSRFLDDGRIRMDNNPAELALRREVVGRKNWLFCGSDDGARWNTIAVSLIASCQMHDIEPWAYLRDVLTLLPLWAKSRVLELAPANWIATTSRPETQKMLADLRLLDRAVPVSAEAATRQRPPPPPSSARSGFARADEVPQPG